jgi:dihydrofolate reductase
MRKIIVSEFVSLDNVMEDPGGAEKTDFGGWTMPFVSSEFHKYKHDELFDADCLLLGRLTYEEFAAAWPKVTDAGDFGDRMNNMPKYVVSTTMQKADWNNTTIIKNIAEEVAALKAQPGKDILVFGSAMLSDTLFNHGLVDMVKLLVYPVTLGEGKKMFKDNTHLKFKLLETRAFETGVVALHYEPLKN